MCPRTGHRHPVACSTAACLPSPSGQPACPAQVGSLPIQTKAACLSGRRASATGVRTRLQRRQAEHAAAARRAGLPCCPQGGGGLRKPPLLPPLPPLSHRRAEHRPAGARTRAPPPQLAALATWASDSTVQMPRTWYASSSAASSQAMWMIEVTLILDPGRPRAPAGRQRALRLAAGGASGRRSRAAGAARGGARASGAPPRGRRRPARVASRRSAQRCCNARKRWGRPGLRLQHCMVRVSVPARTRHAGRQAGAPAARQVTHAARPSIRMGGMSCAGTFTPGNTGPAVPNT